MKIILNNYHKIKLLFLILITVSFPYILIVNSIFVILAVLLTILNLYYSNEKSIVQFNKLSISLFIFYLIEIISLTYTQKDNMNNAIFILQKHLSLIAIPFIFCDFNITKSDRNIILSAFVTTSFAASLICVIADIFTSIHLNNTYFYYWTFSHHRLSAPIGMHAVYFSMYICFSVLIVISYLKNTYNQLHSIKRILLFILLIYFFFIIIMSGARTMIVSIISLILGGLFIYGLKYKSIKLFTCMGLLIFLFTGLVYINPIIKTRFMDMTKTKYENTNYGSYFARTLIWGPGLEVIEDHLILGVGIGDAQQKLDNSYLKNNFKAGIGFNLHNQYLQIILETGCFGLCAYLLMLYFQIRNGITQKHTLYLSFLFLFVIGSLTEALFCRQNGIVFFLFFSFLFYDSQYEQISGSKSDFFSVD